MTSRAELTAWHGMPGIKSDLSILSETNGTQRTASNRRLTFCSKIDQFDCLVRSSSAIDQTKHTGRRTITLVYSLLFPEENFSHAPISRVTAVVVISKRRRTQKKLLRAKIIKTPEIVVVGGGA